MVGNNRSFVSRGGRSFISAIRNKLAQSSPNNNKDDVPSLKSSSLPSSPIATRNRRNTSEDVVSNPLITSCPDIFNSLDSISPSKANEIQQLSSFVFPIPPHLQPDLSDNTIEIGEWQSDVISTIQEVM